MAMANGAVAKVYFVAAKLFGAVTTEADVVTKGGLLTYDEENSLHVLTGAVGADFFF